MLETGNTASKGGRKRSNRIPKEGRGEKLEGGWLAQLIYSAMKELRKRGGHCRSFKTIGKGGRKGGGKEKRGGERVKRFFFTLTFTNSMATRRKKKKGGSILFLTPNNW